MVMDISNRIETSEILINSKEKGLIFLGITNHWMVFLTGLSEDLFYSIPGQMQAFFNRVCHEHFHFFASYSF